MGSQRRLGRWRRREEKIEAAEWQLLGIDPYKPCPISYSVAVALEGFPGHMHYGRYTTVTGRWPDLHFIAWYDCAVCGRLS